VKISVLIITFNGVPVAQSKVNSRVTALNFMQFSLKFLPLNYFSLIYNFCEKIEELR